MPNIIHDYSVLTTTQLLVAFNTAQDTLGHDEDAHLKRLRDHKTGIDRVMRAHEELVNMHGYAELELLDSEHARWIIERPRQQEQTAARPTDGRIGATTIDLSEHLHLLVESNPKRAASRAHDTFRIYFALFEHGEDEAPPHPTGSDYVEAMLAAGYDRKLALSTLHWDLDHDFIRLGEKPADVDMESPSSDDCASEAGSSEPQEEPELSEEQMENAEQEHIAEESKEEE
jgi:hypothetical protein